MDSNISEEFCYYGRNIFTVPACISPSETSFLHFHFCYGKFLDTQLKFTNTITHHRKREKTLPSLVRTSDSAYDAGWSLLKSQDYDNNGGFSVVCFVLNESFRALLLRNS